MIAPRLFVCSGAHIAADDALAKGRRVVELDSVGKKANVNIRLKNLARVFHQHLSPRLVDLLEIASYVFSADCATHRGEGWTDGDSTEPWGRDFSFLIPVRDPGFWCASEATELIGDVLSFLSNDKYSFIFVPLEQDRSDQEQYLQFSDLEDWPFYGPNRVLMFSGGLDSLAGAVETAVAGDHFVLVSHRPVSTLDSRQRKLFSELSKQFPRQLVHIPVWINKEESLGRESTQRTRSFLYAALGTVVAQSLEAGGVRFYENGIVSLNLPIADEALRARASRTTHPIALQLFTSLFTAVTERNFIVDNPYLFKTKTEVVATLAKHQAAHLIAHTCSCSHSMFQSKTRRHCGRCSQCIDRRFAIAAAGLLAHDSERDYVSDVFVGPRKDALERAIAVDYARHGIELYQRSETDLAAIFNAEISRAVRYETKRSEAAQRIVSMHKRHGEVVNRVLEKKITENAAKLIDGTLDHTSLLALVIGQQHLMQRRQSAPEAVDSGLANREGAAAYASSAQSEPASLARIEQMFKMVLAKFEATAPRRGEGKKRHRLGKRDTVIFAAIRMELKGMKYCSFLQDHGIRPKWSDTGPGSYSKSYQGGDPWRKKVQDEKTRAKLRLNNYSDAELAEAVNAYLPGEFDRISPLLDSHNSRNASKSFRRIEH